MGWVVRPEKPWARERDIMLTLSWILRSYVAAFLALLGGLFLVALFAAIFGFTYVVFLYIISAATGLVFGAVYRKGVAKGASLYRPLRLALAGSWLFLGALSAYVEYATVAWTLHKTQADAPAPNLWAYMSEPSKVHTLGRREAGGRFNAESMGFCCVGGAMLAFWSAVFSLRNPSDVATHRTVSSPNLRFYSCQLCNWEGEEEPSEPLGDAPCPRCGCLMLGGTKTRPREQIGRFEPPVVDTKSGQRGAGFLLIFLAGGANALLWLAPRPLGSAFAIPAIICPLVLVFGVGLVLWPLDPIRLRASREVHHATRFSHLPMAWIFFPVVGLAIGLLNWWLLSEVR